MHTDAAVQQASLELLRHAHYLYKSGVARLPAAGSCGLPGAGSLCRLDELLVRCSRSLSHCPVFFMLNIHSQNRSRLDHYQTRNIPRSLGPAQAF